MSYKIDGEVRTRIENESIITVIDYLEDVQNEITERDEKIAELEDKLLEKEQEIEDLQQEKEELEQLLEQYRYQAM